MLHMRLMPQTDANQHIFWDQSQAAKHFKTKHNHFKYSARETDINKSQ